MKVINIKLSLLENAKLFADIASRYPFDVDLRVGRYVVDGKSVLGVCSLDMSKPITVEIYSDDCDKFLDEISMFILR
ncbi:MAG: HPr family phosphocarrier protein [Clostridia bacterium]|jgi:phosphotransferase system HPr-like phosphotransfer protein|nr:HPr family phosphocarrier protein [Clostridia bacterium]MBR5984953.1 HPr family phosphocarrier protein [Clostridia bacterium]MBR6007947.1 HPr family phosphocarrier protein [Clostridia bacterium]MCR4620842.1 HPr family phosphocarrier protein [Clostridiales bacterium]